MKSFSKADQDAANRWWRSLPAGKKQHLVKRCNLQDQQRRVLYWLNSVKPMNHEGTN